MFGWTLEQKVALATDVRIWALLAAAVLAFVSYGATWAQTRWQQQLGAQQKEASIRREAEANERIAAARAEALKAQASIADANKTIAELQGETAAANLRAAELEKQTVEMRQKFANRRITEDQHKRMRAILATRPADIILQMMPDPETVFYASDISKTLEAAGWKIVGRESLLGETWEGVVVRDATDEAALGTLIAALNAAGLAFNGAAGDKRPTLTLIIGGKPAVY